jgi:anti-anti-sigma factor
MPADDGADRRRLTVHLDIETSETGSEASMALAGRFDAHEADSVLSGLNRLLDNGARIVGLDLQEVEFIDSTGLAVLTRVMKRARELGGDLVLVAPSTPVRVILELTALDRAFIIRDSAPGVPLDR